MELDGTLNLDTTEAEEKLKALVEKTLAASKEFNALTFQEEMESIRSAFNFGKSVQRIEDRADADSARSQILLAYTFCGLSGFMVALVVCAVLEHSAATVGHLVYLFFGAAFGFALCAAVASVKLGWKVW